MQEKLTDCLSSWPTLNMMLQKLTEAQCLALLKAERKGRRRLNYLLRIHARYNRLRAVRERTELLQGE